MRKRNLPNRKSIRLKGWDYRNPGLYYVTICTNNRQHHFGEIRDGIMGLSIPGCVAWHFWCDLPHHHPNVVLDEFIVMPNHLHGIVGITSKNDNEPPKPVVGTLHATSLRNDPPEQNSGNRMSDISPKSGSLSVILRSFKSAITRWCNSHDYEYFGWQERFHDHIIRNEQSLNKIRRYIRDNPFQWDIDRNNLNNF